MEGESEALSTVREVRLMLAEARRDAGVGVMRDIGLKAIETVSYLFNEEQKRRKKPSPANPDYELSNRLSNLRSLTDLAERLYPNESRLSGIERVKAILK